MEFEYINKEIEEAFSDLYNVTKSKNILIRKIGSDLARKAKQRCDQLKAAETYLIYKKTALGKPHSLEGDLETSIGISLTDNIRLVIEPIPPDLSAEALATCRKVKIIGVVDYHGKKNWLIS